MTFFDTPELLTEQILVRQGCHLHYWVGGPDDKPLVAFIHGATMDHRMFNAQVQALLPHYRVLVTDLRGHGKSKPIGNEYSPTLLSEDILAILDDVGAPRAVLCGQSLGGYVAQYLYLKAPERVAAMIIIGATPISKGYARRDLWALRTTAPLFRLFPYRPFRRMAARATARTALVQAYAFHAIQQIERDEFLRIWSGVTQAIDEKGRPGFTIQVPLLLLQGDHDRAGTIRRDMPTWATSEAQATFRIIPNAGHNANQDNPDFTNRAILEFLQEHVAG